MSDVTITEADVESFRHKLDGWAATLNEGEQAILAMVATRAFPDAGNDDVQGYAGKVARGDFHFLKTVDKASPKLYLAMDLDPMVGIHVTFGPPDASLG